ncbi:hypothetical protein [uncultured Sphingomonas sp.]|uniref:hypothetical protein n=1 Tax=uncultured Sphingomonas sp. TaxID=158754 RepID=UPI0035CBEED6
MSNPDSPEPPDGLLLFTPVPTAYCGANGWSSEVQRAFVAALARCGVVAAAARSVGRSPSSAYQLRRRAGVDGNFTRAWDEAQARGSEQAMGKSMAGGMAVRRTEMFHRDRSVGWRTSYDNCLAYAALRALDRYNLQKTADVETQESCWAPQRNYRTGVTFVTLRRRCPPCSFAAVRLSGDRSAGGARGGRRGDSFSRALFAYDAACSSNRATLPGRRAGTGSSRR